MSDYTNGSIRFSIVRFCRVDKASSHKNQPITCYIIFSMITGLSLDGFKCFHSIQEFKFNRLNILAGINGRGKSTVFQSLLMLSQSQLKNDDIAELCPNGKYQQLSAFKKLINNYSGNKDKVVRIGIKTDIEQFRDVKMGYKAQGDWNGELCELVIDDKNYFTKSESIDSSDNNQDNGIVSIQKTYPSFNKILGNFYYISAHRLGPRLYEEKSEEERCNPQGALGEKNLATIHSHKGTNGLKNPDGTDSKNLEDALQAWMTYILGKTQLEISDSENTLHINMKNHGAMSQMVNSINMGFGYSYILSILLVSLIAPVGSTVFIENPEAHLHPRAQAALMHLLTNITANGIQVFLETHSEHIVNSARLYALEDDKPISHDQISIHFFDEDFKVSYVPIDNKGQIESWPKGFFDLQEEQLMRILQLGILKK